MTTSKTPNGHNLHANVVSILSQGLHTVALLSNSGEGANVLHVPPKYSKKLLKIEEPLGQFHNLENNIDLMIIPLTKMATVEIHYAHLLRELKIFEGPILFVGENQKKIIECEKIQNTQYIEKKDWEKSCA